MDGGADAIDRAVQAERDWVTAQLEVIRTRLNAMDEATKVLNETVTRTPTEIQKEVAHLRELTDTRFGAVGSQLTELGDRLVREAIANTERVNAAFAAQKEAAAKQDEANQKAIDKSERATSETVAKNAASAAQANAALTDKIDDQKERVARIESVRIGGAEQRTESRASAAAIYSLVGFVITVATVLGIIAATTP